MRRSIVLYFLISLFIELVRDVFSLLVRYLSLSFVRSFVRYVFLYLVLFRE